MSFLERYRGQVHYVLDIDDFVISPIHYTSIRSALNVSTIGTHLKLKEFPDLDKYEGFSFGAAGLIIHRDRKVLEQLVILYAGLNIGTHNITDNWDTLGEERTNRFRILLDLIKVLDLI